MDTTEREYKSPVRKLLRFFETSRDQWKAKQQELKTVLKKEQNQVRAVEKSRQAWRAKAEAAEQQIECLTAEISMLKKKF